MDFWILYLMTRTEAIGNALILPATFGTLFGAFGVLVSIGMADEMGEPMATKIGRVSKRTLIVASICGLVSVLMPTRKDWYLMLGGYYVSHIDGIDQLPKNAVGAANEFLKQYEQDKKPEPKKAGGGA